MKNKRLFVAVELLPEIKQELSRLVQTWQNQLPLKTFKPENLHLTFLFLGNVSMKELLAIKHCLRATAQAHEPFSLQSERIEPGPNLHRPRLMWLTIPRAPYFAKLKKQTAECLTQKAPQIASNIDDKQFFSHTHITIVRFKQSKKVSNLVLAGCSRPFKRSLPVKNLILYESQLTPDGPIYIQLDRYPLKHAKPSSESFSKDG